MNGEGWIQDVIYINELNEGGSVRVEGLQIEA